jgi:microcystin-dependent protein
MPVPSAITDLSTTAGSNYPAGSESPTTVDDYLRAHASFIAQLYATIIPVGVMMDFGGTSAPTGFLVCDGTAVSRTTYSALFTAIGTTWGSGDGSTTFNVPDMRRRTAIGSGGTATDGPANTVGSTGGAQTKTLSTAELPAHSHSIFDAGHSHSVSDPGHSHSANISVGSSGTGGGLGVATPSAGEVPTSRINVNAAGTGIGIVVAGTGISIANTGSGTAFGLMQPSAVVTKIIRF